MYSVRATFMKLFCQILIEFNLLRAPICDVLLISVLFNTQFLNRSCKPLPWIYAYSIRDEEKKNRAREMQNYMRMIQIPGLLDRLEEEFDINWYQGYRGYISIYGYDEFVEATPYPLIDSETINQEKPNNQNPNQNKNQEKNQENATKPPTGIFSRMYNSINNYRKKEPYFFFLVVAIFLVILFFLVKWFGKLLYKQFEEWYSTMWTGTGGGGSTVSSDLPEPPEPPKLSEPPELPSKPFAIASASAVEQAVETS